MPRKTSCVYSQCIRQGSKRGCRTQKRCVTKTQVSLTLCKLQEIQKSDTCSWGQNIALTLGSSCSSTYELQCRPLLSLHPPPPTDLNIGVESAPLEGHMWPHSQLIRRVQFFFYAECSHVSGQNRNCKCGPKLCCGGWLDLSHTKQVKTTRGNQMLWFYGLKDILQCVKRKLCSQQVTHGPPGAKHRTGR